MKYLVVWIALLGLLLAPCTKSLAQEECESCEMDDPQEEVVMEEVLACPPPPPPLVQNCGFNYRSLGMVLIAAAAAVGIVIAAQH